MMKITVYNNPIYNYEANRLIAVDDDIPGQNNMGDFTDNGHIFSSSRVLEYHYDDNGNMTEDINRGIKVNYLNELNLPKTIAFEDGYIENRYFYDGTKYRKQEFDPEGNLLNDETYFGNLVLCNGRPYHILHDDGYVNLLENGLVGELNFHVKDHPSVDGQVLGNVRCVLSETPDRQPIIVQASGYFPFGMLFQSEQMQTSANANANKYLYNGKEVQDMPGKWYNYGWRYYDPQIARWYVPDPKSEKYFELSNYIYCANNPVKYVDPAGDTIIIGNFIDRNLNKLGIKTKYVQKVEMDLIQLRSSGVPEITKMIKELEKSPREHKIIPTKDEKEGNSTTLNMKKAKNGEKQGTTINYNPNKKTTIAGDYRMPVIGLTHEMRHSSDADKGVMNFDKTSNGIPLYEVKAVKTENKVRKYFGAHKRTTYGRKNIPRGMLREDYKIK